MENNIKVELFPPKESWEKILKREEIFNNVTIDNSVKTILKDIKDKGDEAIIEYLLKFDNYKCKSQDFKVPLSYINECHKYISKDLEQAIDIAYNNIYKFHYAQKEQGFEMQTTKGIVCEQRVIPIDNIGLYIPGGSAPLFSTVLMLGIPAQIAGCNNISIFTPCNSDGNVSPIILYAAKKCGINNIFRIGGAVAIGAMAYGTQTIQKCNKIFGPGNDYVTAAKRIISSTACAIDIPAGPSEIMIIADNSANIKFICADILSQLEHGASSQAIVVTTEPNFPLEIVNELKAQRKNLSRADIINKSIENSKIILVSNIQDAIEIANIYSPEHLIISTNSCNSVSKMIKNAGSIFLGNYTPESAGDYASGTNHTLPTNGWAKSFGGVNLASFTKKITIQSISKEGLINIGKTIEIMAQAEELFAHKNAVSIRLSNLNNINNGNN